MDDTLRQLTSLRTREKRVAMATLVRTHGTTPRKEGARMFVGEGGRVLGSVTIGGCVDSRVIAEAEAVLHEGGAKLLSMPLGDDDALEIGLTCGGTVDVLLERVELGDVAGAAGAYELASTELAMERPVIVAALLESGRRIVARADGSRALTLGEDGLDDAVAREAGVMLEHGQASKVAMVVAGARTVEVFFEVLTPPLTMLIVGATHLAMPLARLAKIVGLRTIVVDPRERFATPERFPDADELRVGMASEIVGQLPLGRRTLVVLVAHDYKVELPVLRAVLRRDVAYVGVLGSRRRGAALRELLADALTPDELARIHLPVGLDIGARAVPEIALSILAEALAVSRGRRGGPLTGT